MQITVRILGGVMDDDRITSVRGDRLTRTDHGKIRADRRLAPGDVANLQRLANDVVDLTLPEPMHPKAVDGGITTIEIAGDKTKRIELWAGEDAPEPVWALLTAIETLDRDAESSQY